MVDELMSGLSDDLTKFTKITEDQNNDDDGDKNQDKGENPFFDINSIPEDQREAFSETFEKMEAAFEEKTTGLNDLKNKTDVVDALVRKLNEAAPKKEVTPEKTKGGEFGFKFEENDYYAPAFKEVIDLVEGLKVDLVGVQNSTAEDKQVNFQGNVKKFFSDNKVDNNIIVKMDNIANELGPQAYNNLPRLLNLAKMELGIDIKPKATPKPNVRGQIEKETMRKTVQHKEPSSMAEAWAQAEDQLSE